MTFVEGFMEVELMVTKRDDDDDNKVNIEQSASGRCTGRVLQFLVPVRHTLTIGPQN